MNTKRQTPAEVKKILEQYLDQEPKRPQNGIFKIMNKNGNVRFEEHYVNGKMIFQRKYHDNGDLEAEIPFKDEEIHGIVKVWGRGGKFLGEYTLNKGLGVVKDWTDNGKLIGELEILPKGLMRYVTYADEGKEHTTYMLNGNIISKSKFLNLTTQ